MSPKSFFLPVGYHDFYKDKPINYHLNRWYSMGYRTREEAYRAGAGVHARDELKGELLAFAEWPAGCHRDLAATFSYRAAEFFTHPQDPDKMPLYDEFQDHFYTAVHHNQLESHSIPYRDGSLLALSLSPEESRGTFLIHGGTEEEQAQNHCQVGNRQLALDMILNWTGEYS